MANYQQVKTLYFASVLWTISGISIETTTSGISIETITLLFDDTTTEFPPNTTTPTQSNTTTFFKSNTITTFPINATTTTFPLTATTTLPINATTTFPISTMTALPNNATTSLPFNTTTAFTFNTTTTFPMNTSIRFPINANTTVPSMSPFNMTTSFPVNATLPPISITTTFPFNTTTTFSFNTTAIFPSYSPTASPTFPSNATTTFLNATSDLHEIITTEFSVNASTEFQINNTTVFQENTATELPEVTSTEFPETTSTELPANTTTEFLENTTTELPANTTTKFQENTTIQLRVNTTTELQGNTTTEFQENTTIESPVNTTTELQGNTTIESPVNTTTELQGNTTIESPVNTTTELQENTTIESPVNTTTEFQGHTTIESPVNTTTELQGNTTIESPVNTTTEFQGNTTIESPVNTTTEFQGNTTIESPVNTTAELQENTTTEYQGNTTIESPVYTTIEYQGNTTIEFQETTTTEYQENTTTESPVNTTIEFQGNTTTESPVNTTIEFQENTTTESPVNTPTESQENTTTESPVKTTTEFQGNTTIELPVNATTEFQERTTIESPVNTTIESQENTTTESPVNTTIEFQENTTTELPVNTPTEFQENTTMESAVNTTTEFQESTTIESPANTTTEFKENTTAEFEEKFSTELPVSETTEFQENATAELPVNTTTEFQENTTTGLPVNTTTELPVNTTTEFQETTTTDLPLSTTIEYQENTTIEFQVNTATELPVNTTTEFQENTTTELTVNATTEFQENTTTELQETTTTEFQETTTAESPVNTTTEIQETTTTESPANTTTEVQETTTTESPVNTTIEVQETTTAESPVNTTTEVQETTTSESPVNTTTEVQETTTTESPVNTTTEVQETTTTESPVNTTTEVQETTTTESPANTTTEVQETTTTETPVNTTTEVQETTTTESPVNTTTEYQENTPTESPVNTTTELQETTTAEPPVNTSTEYQENTTTESPVNTTTELQGTTTAEPPVNTSTEFQETTTTEYQENTTAESPVNTTTEFQENTTTESPVNTTTEFQEDTTTELPVNTTTELHEITTAESPVNTTTEFQETTTAESPVNTTTEFQENTTAESPVNTTTEFQEDTTTELPVSETTVFQENTTTELPISETTVFQESSTTEFQENATTEFPASSSTDFLETTTAQTEATAVSSPTTIVSSTAKTTLLDNTERTTDGNTVRCLQNVDSQKTTWYSTVAGETRTVVCDEGYTGVKTRFCTTSGRWDLPRYDCLRRRIQALNVQSSSLDPDSSDDDIADILSNAFNEANADGEKLTERDISALVETLDKISSVLFNMTSFSNDSIVQTFTDLVSAIIDTSNEKTWESLTSQENTTGETVLESMNRIVEVVGRSLNDFTTPESDSFHITSNNLDFKVERAVGKRIIYPNPTEVNSDWLLQSGSEMVFDLTSLPENDGQYTVAAMSYKDMSSILPLSSLEQELNGQIMSFSMFPSITETLSTPISITFHQSTDLLTKPSCTYWKFNGDTGGGWSTDGCTVAETSPSSTVCTCTHLTDFAVVLSLQDCGEPTQPTNGFVYYDSTTYRSVADFVCDSEYILIGNQSTECLYNGTWSLGSTACTQIEEEVKLCPRDTDTRGNVWLETQAGNTREKKCQTGHTGDIIRRCRQDGTWRSPQYNCIREKVQEIEKQVAEVSTNTTENDFRQTVAEIRNITELTKDQNATEEKLTDGEIYVLSSSLEKVGGLVQNDTTFLNDDVVDDFVESASNLIDETNADSWKSLRESNSTGAETLLTAVTTLVEAVGQTLNETEKKTVVKKNLAVEAQKYTNNDVVFPVPQQIDIGTEDLEWVKETRSQIQLQTESLQDKSIPYVITMVMYKDIAEILPSSSIQNGTTSLVTDDDENQINGPILAMSVLPKENAPTIFDPPISITFEHIEGNLTAPVCSFWRFNKKDRACTPENFYCGGCIGKGYFIEKRQGAFCENMINGLGAWSSDGCWVNSTNETITICHCNHLTNFAILMSPFKEVDSASTALRIISIVGIGISICCVIITFLVHICLWRHVRNDRTTILMNLCVALLFAYIVFLGGVDRTESKTVCAIIAGFLQYLYLVVFCVMFVEGIEVAITVLYVFKTKSRIKLLLISAWVLPGVIVAISAGITQGDGYGNEIFCWLSVDSGLIWSFVGPALVIIFFNVICIFVVVRALCNTATMKTKKTKEKVRASVRSLCVLVPVMGISWLLGIFYVDDGFIFIQFIFTILNGLQGLFIFIFHCLLNKQVRNALKLKKRRRSAQETFQSSSKNSPRKDKHAIHSKDTSSYVDEAGDSRSSDNQIQQDWTRKLLQPQIKMTGTKYNSPMSAYGNGTLRPAASFSSRSRDHMSSDINSSHNHSSRNVD